MKLGYGLLIQLKYLRNKEILTEIFDSFHIVPFKQCSLFNFSLISDYCTPLSLDGFPYATTLLSLSFKLYSEFFEQNRSFYLSMKI